MQKTARKLGHTIKVETQGAMGIENELSQSEIDAAEVAILATDIALELAERFSRIRKVQVPVQSALKNPEAVFAKALTEANPTGLPKAAGERVGGKNVERVPTKNAQ